MPWDISLVEGENGKPVMHLVECALVRALAEEGVPVLTMFGCESLPSDAERHWCFKDIKEA